MTQAPLHWIKQIEQTAINTWQIPLSGYPPAFPWKEVSKQLGELFQVPGFEIQLKHIKVLPPQEISQGFGINYIPLTIELTPLQGQAFFLMGKEEISQFTSLVLTSAHSNKGFLSSSFKEGFYYYICTEVLAKLYELEAFGDLALTIAKTATLPQEESLCLDIEIIHPKHTFYGRVVCPSLLHEAFKNHFREKHPLSSKPSLAKEVCLSAAVTIGQTELSVASYKELNVGDFIVLDQCSFDPVTKKGTAFLCLENTPILRMRFKDDHLKVVNYATYHEEKHLMDPLFPESDETHEIPSHETDEFGENEHIESVEVSKTEETQPDLISAQQIPLTLVIEVTRIKMNLEEILNLSPGNTIELPIKPQQGVDITIQGKKVAKAELIKVGEMLGVKILKLA